MGFFDDILAQNTQAQQMAVRVGASTYADPKIITGMIGTVFKPELLNTDLLKVVSQGATPEQILLAAWGACGTATGETFTAGVPPLGSQMFDTSFGLPIPSALQVGESVRVGRDSRTGQRTILRKQGVTQKRQGFLQDLRPLPGVLVRHYGTYSFVDANGVTHQPPGKRDPVVNLPGVGAHIDNDTLKFGPNGEIYADFFGTGSVTGTGSVGQSINGLNAGHGLEIIPGFSPLDGCSLTIEAGGSVPAGIYSWAFCYIIDGKRTPLSPVVSGTTVDGPPTTYHQPHLLIPGKPDIIHATALELYRKDASVGADGRIHTKFAYTSAPGVLIGDSSITTVIETSGPYTGLPRYTVVATRSGVDKGDTFYYNPLCRVKADDPPIPYDPRDGSLTTFIENGANDGSSIFKTSDGGAFNQITGDITYPPSSALNHSGFRLVDTLTPSASPQDYIDTKTDAALGILFQRDPTVINIKPARYLVAPFSSMSPVTGTVPPLYELSGLTFSSSNPAVSNDGVAINPKYGVAIDKNNFVDVLLSASLTIPTAGQGAQTTSTVPGYDAVMYKRAGLKFQGASGRELAVAFNPSTLELDSQDRLNVIASGGGAALFSATPESDGGATTQDITTNTFHDILWHNVLIDTSSFLGVDNKTVTIPATGTYEIRLQANVKQSLPNIGAQYYLRAYINGGGGVGGDGVNYISPSFIVAQTSVQGLALFLNATRHFDLGDTILFQTESLGSTSTSTSLDCGSNVTNIAIKQIA